MIGDTNSCITTYLKMEMSQSQEWFGKAMKKQTAAVNHTAETIPSEILEIFWLPRCSTEKRANGGRLIFNIKIF